MVTCALGLVPLVFGVFLEALMSVVSLMLVFRLHKPYIDVVVVDFLHLLNLIFILRVGAYSIKFVTSFVLSSVSLLSLAVFVAHLAFFFIIVL